MLKLMAAKSTLIRASLHHLQDQKDDQHDNQDDQDNNQDKDNDDGRDAAIVESR